MKDYGIPLPGYGPWKAAGRKGAALLKESYGIAGEEGHGKAMVSSLLWSI